MFRTTRTIALIASVALAGGAAADPAKSPVKRLGKTVVQHEDDKVKAVLSWRYANQTFEKEPWLLLELAFAAEGKAFDVNREDVSLLTPDGERLARRERLARARSAPGGERLHDRVDPPASERGYDSHVDGVQAEGRQSAVPEHERLDEQDDGHTDDGGDRPHHDR